MAIKTTLTYIQIGKGLEEFKGTVLADEVPFVLLRSIGVSETLLQRYRNGNNRVVSFNGLLIKKTFAYRSATAENLASELERMKTDKLLLKAEPAIIAVSDGVSLLAYDPAAKESYDNKLSKLYTDYSFFSPLWGIGKYRIVEENPADVKAAEKMAKIHDEIRRYNDIASDEDVHDLNIFMTRLLFCFFAEDTAIFEKSLFTNSLERFTRLDGSDLSAYLTKSFQVMDMDVRTEVNSIYAQFPYVNGGLFHKHIVVPKMGMRARKLILECGELNWAEINPDIFGSMIQAVVTPELRGGLGMHYTSVPNIMKLIGPLFLNDLHEAFYLLSRTQQEKKNQLDIEGCTQKEYTDSCKPIIEKCNALLKRMSKMKFLDPACGSGNFLIITYKQLRMLEIQLLKLITDCQWGQMRMNYIMGSMITISQFYGIELDDFAHETAILSLWLAEHQMNLLFTKNFGVNIQALPLKTNCNIVQGNACRIDWNTVCPHTKEEEVLVMGNPPYVGGKLQNKEQKEDMQFVFHEFKKFKDLDYISIWFYLAAKYINGSTAQYAFVSTNSICQGNQVALLWNPILELNIKINFAYTSFKWNNNAKDNAAVICIIVGLCDKDKKNTNYLYKDSKKQQVDVINPYLSAGSSSLIFVRSFPISILPKGSLGTVPKDDGNLILSINEKNDLINKHSELRPYIKRFVGSHDFINGEERWILYIPDAVLHDLYEIDEIRNRLNKTSDFRLASTELSTRNLSSSPNKMFFDSYKNTECIIIPRHSSERREYIPIGYLNRESIIADSANTIPNAPLWCFGVITSMIHLVWVKTVAGRLKNDYRYSIQLCYNTFPFPPISSAKKIEIEDAANLVLDARAYHYELTLAELYDPDKMPDDLRQAHHALDLLIDSCYQSKPFANDEERLECLFKLYEEMT